MQIEEELLNQTLKKSFDYATYAQMMDRLVEEGKSTGPNQSEEYIHYTKLGKQRMKRVFKTFKASSNLVHSDASSYNKKIIWLIATESWCGDAAQNIPIIEKIAAANKIVSKYFLRDENPEMMEYMLTDGGLSIPKLAVIDTETSQILKQWGPRPETAQKMVLARKNSPHPEPYESFVVKLQQWYNANQSAELSSEIFELLNFTIEKSASKST